MTKLTEDQIRIITRIAREEMGDTATLDTLRDVVGKTVEQIESRADNDLEYEPMGHALAILISADGQKNWRILSDAVGDTGCRIVERVEKQMESFATLLAVIDVSNCGGGFEALKRRLSHGGNEGNVRVVLQSEEALRGRSNRI